MKNFLLLSSLFLLSLGTFFIFPSCSGSTRLEDCDCDVYPFTDTFRVARVDTITQVDTLYKKVGDQSTYYVQIGAFYNKSYAEQFALDAKSNLYQQIYIISTKDNLYRVMVGDKTTSLDDAKVRLGIVKSKGYDDAFVRDQYGPISK